MKFKWKLIFWDTVIYFRYKKDAQKYKDGLDYYRQEDAMIVKEDKNEN